MDEPCSALDPIATEKIENLINRINFDLDAAAPQANLNSTITNDLKKKFIALITKISELQEKYAARLSKYETIKQEGLKRKERLKSVDSEMKNWIDLKISSEKKFLELNEIEIFLDLLNKEELHPYQDKKT